MKAALAGKGGAGKPAGGVRCPVGAQEETAMEGQSFLDDQTRRRVAAYCVRIAVPEARAANVEEIVHRLLDLNQYQPGFEPKDARNWAWIAAGLDFGLQAGLEPDKRLAAIKLMGPVCEVINATLLMPSV